MASYAASSSTSPARMFSKIRCAKILKECKQMIANVYGSIRTHSPENSVVKSWRRPVTTLECALYCREVQGAVPIWQGGVPEAKTSQQESFEHGDRQA
ncbi:hypothetical protein ISCGN_004618 [Ixodes scapularis]